MKKIIILLGSFFLISCHQQLTHQYLLQHSDELAHEFYRCKKANQPNQEYCDMVQRTEEDFVGLANVRQANPEQFGQQILSAEQQLLVLTTALEKARRDFPKGSSQLVAAEHAYEDQLEKVNILLAVVRATTFGD